MQHLEQLTADRIVEAMRYFSLSDLENIKNAIIKREIYFKKFRKDKIENIVSDFAKEGYSRNFLKDLDNGLRKSSVYHED
jgi:hypothetical protein